MLLRLNQMRKGTPLVCKSSAAKENQILRTIVFAVSNPGGEYSAGISKEERGAIPTETTVE
jgi:hypothetical protein